MIRELATRYGTMFVPDTDYAQFPWLANGGASVEHQFIVEVAALLGERKPGVVLDIGANYGTWSLALAPVAIMVFAFEPQWPVFCLLDRAASLAPKVHAVHEAIGASTDMVKVPRCDLNLPGNFGGVSLVEPFKEQPRTPMDDAMMVTVDSFIVDNFPVTFIKMDIEGGEEEALTGALDTIRRWRPILFIEADHPRTDRKRLWSRLEALGYACVQRGGNILGMPTCHMI